MENARASDGVEAMRLEGLRRKDILMLNSLQERATVESGREG